MNTPPIQYTLPNGKKILLKYLTKEELDNLLKVPTTICQAKKVRKRNLLLWEKFNDNDTSDSTIGCPHCKYTGEGHLCSTCAWQLYPEQFGKTFLHCTSVTFGGVYFDNQVAVSYSTDSESLNDTKESMIDCYSDEASDLIEEVENLLLGHVEWAEAVILQGGIPWPNGKMIAKRQPLK
jgi:hypothetical protein